MRVDIDQRDIEAIAKKVLEFLLPLIPSTNQEDRVFDKQSLAEYLHVDISWIDKQITKRAIPFFKAGKYTRFKKSQIDQWIEIRRIDPISDLKNYKKSRSTDS